MIFEITEDEFEDIINGTVDGVYLAVVFSSKAIHWLANDGCTVAGVVHRDHDRNEVTFSWAVYRDGECMDYTIGILRAHDALRACMSAMREVDR